MYEKHRGISPEAPEVDLLEATRECYQVAAEAGVTKAMVNVGVLYLSGRLPGREQGEALVWFQKAADEGDLSGELYLQNRKVRRTSFRFINPCFSAKAIAFSNLKNVVSYIRQQSNKRANFREHGRASSSV